MSSLREEQIHDIRKKSDIVDVIARYVNVERKGKNYVCVCPFHNDHNPSMHISQDKQIYKCFSCNAGGNVFTFVKNIEKISFIEAVYKVAQYSGVTLDRSFVLEKKVQDPHIERLYKICEETSEFCNYQLDTLEARTIKDYLHRRGINDDIIKKFKIGYNPSDNALYRFLHAKKYSDDIIIEAGLGRMNEMGIMDVFDARIMIPIHDAYGNLVAFTARKTRDDQLAKYINTTQTTIYQKGNIVFNYHRVKSNIRNFKQVILVEGAMDVLAFEKIGYANALAMLGTAITEEQLHLLKQLHLPVVVCYDGDEAGQNATYKFGKLARSKHLPFEIVDNRYGLDPDEIIEAYGMDELKALSAKTLSWIDFLFIYLLKRYDLKNYSEKKEFALEIASEISSLNEAFEKSSYYIRLRELTGFDMQTQDQSNLRKDPVNKKISQPRNNYLIYPKSGRTHAEYEILSQMLHGKSAANYFKEELGVMIDDSCNMLALYIFDYYRQYEEMDIAMLLDIISEDAIKQLLLDVSNWELARNEIHLDVLKDSIEKLKKCFIKDGMQKINEQIEAINDPLEKARLADQRNKLKQQND